MKRFRLGAQALALTCALIALPTTLSAADETRSFDRGDPDRLQGNLQRPTRERPATPLPRIQRSPETGYPRIHQNQQTRRGHLPDAATRR